LANEKKIDAFFDDVTDKQEHIVGKNGKYITRKVLGDHDMMTEGKRIQVERIEAERKKAQSQGRKSMSLSTS
jgi:hypothetical protein